MAIGLQKLDIELHHELSLLNYPPSPWLTPSPAGVLDVAIIGGGMAGLTAAISLMRLGVNNIQVFDINPEGYEGPWLTYARMLTLRSTKELMGPALNIPKLTIQQNTAKINGNPSTKSPHPNGWNT